MSANNSYTALHTLRKAKEVRDQKHKERVFGTAIAVGIMALGSWALWNHILWLAIPFMILLVVDVVKSLKEPLRYKVCTIGYAALLPLSMWNHISGLGFLAAVFVGVAFTMAYMDMKNK